MNLRMILAIAFLFSSPAALDLMAQTQAEMPQQAISDFNKATAKMDSVLKELLSKLDADSQAKLKASRDAWLAYRDAQAAFEADRLARGGTIASQILYITKTTLTEKRTIELRALI
jgi:uncharacterized protein YecT (DUF1311 family)